MAPLLCSQGSGASPQQQFLLSMCTTQGTHLTWHAALTHRLLFRAFSSHFLCQIHYPFFVFFCCAPRHQAQHLLDRHLVCVDYAEWRCYSDTGATIFSSENSTATISWAQKLLSCFPLWITDGEGKEDIWDRVLLNPGNLSEVPGKCISRGGARPGNTMALDSVILFKFILPSWLRQRFFVTVQRM